MKNWTINKYIFLLSILVLSCSKDYIEEEVYLSNSTPIIEVQTVTPTTVVPETNTYVTLSERYSSINETTGFFKGQQYFDGYLSKEYIENTLTLSNLDNHSVFRTFHRNIAILDLDGDFKQDIVAFASSFCLNHEYANHPGKLLFISNYKESSDVLAFDIDAHNGSKMEVNDFNLDGISDVLFYTHDTKPNFFVSEENYGGATNFEPNNPILIRFDNTIITNKVGIKADSHTGTSGDIDNDGDIDKSDEYLAKKRAAISKAMKEELFLEGKGRINEAFATWEMQFAPMKLSGVDLDPNKKYKVKARSTVEAIKKAAKMAGLKGDSWMATQTHKLVKVG